MANLISKITATNGTTYDIKDRVSTFGGTNLLQDSELYCYTAAQNNNLDKTAYKTNGSLTYSRGAIQNEGFYIDTYLKLKPNSQYITSFEAACTSGTITQFYVYRGVHHESIELYMDGLLLATAENADVTANISMGSNVYHNFMIKFSMPSTITKQNNYLGHILQWNKQVSTAFTVAMRGLKCELGNKPTGWTPAPQDLVTYNSTDEAIEFPW